MSIIIIIIINPILPVFLYYLVYSKPILYNSCYNLAARIVSFKMFTCHS